MSYTKPVSFGIKCDKCGKEMAYRGSIFFSSSKEADTIAIHKLGWSVFGGIHLCPECTSFVAKDKCTLMFYQIYENDL